MKEQSDQGLHCLPMSFCFKLWNTKFKDITVPDKAADDPVMVKNSLQRLPDVLPNVVLKYMSNSTSIRSHPLLSITAVRTIGAGIFTINALGAGSLEHNIINPCHAEPKHTQPLLTV